MDREEELQSMDIQDYRIAFVGDWAKEDFRSFYFGGAVMVMVYAEFNVRGTWHHAAVPGGRFVQHSSTVVEVDRSECEAMIIRKSADDVRVERC